MRRRKLKLKTIYSRVRRRSFKRPSRRRFTMARRRRFSRRARPFYSRRRGGGGGRLGKIGGIFRNSTIQRVGLSLGIGTIVALVTSRLAPNFTPVAALAGEYLGGGIEGAIGAEAVKLISGAPSILNGIGGIGGQSGLFNASGAA